MEESIIYKYKNNIKFSNAKGEEILKNLSRQANSKKHEDILNFKVLEDKDFSSPEYARSLNDIYKMDSQILK